MKRESVGGGSDHGISRNLDDRERERGLSRGAEMRLLDDRANSVLL